VIGVSKQLKVGPYQRPNTRSSSKISIFLALSGDVNTLKFWQ
jgi:hypothetical protein